MHLNRIVADILEMLAYIVPNGWEATFWTIQSTCSTVKATLQAQLVKPLTGSQPSLRASLESRPMIQKSKPSSSMGSMHCKPAGSRLLFPDKSS